MAYFTYWGGMLVDIINEDGYRIICDPFIKDNPFCKEDVSYFYNSDLILVTHATYDHYGDVSELLKHSSAKVMCGRESWAKIQKEFPEIDESRFFPTVYGDCRTFGNVTVRTTPAWHSSGVMYDGIRHNYCPLGFVVMVEPGVRYYHTGDTAFTAEFNTVRDLFHPNVMVVGISGITETAPCEMVPEEAARAVSVFSPEVVIPTHYCPESPALEKFRKALPYFAPYTYLCEKIGKKFRFVPARIQEEDQ